ncbi:beta-carotene 15,15'-monooxygenase, Brp/Blh family [Halorubrum aquaticum]|uniref:Probable beta-carotene 15,15'-dioxygenase n=1 Tax=Halorubrum aquaticum TaxID=387340 RepID=A0A1I3ATH6_9EURY|nr:Brp/Blh family beta-carotene 15,15'-dioxygenase [Halorubrum aquaticum]SFH53428.1 beta-carotene 15,15'-monooxygenase, Brp/Blh family [Halorubrum aquaticum]
MTDPGNDDRAARSVVDRWFTRYPAIALAALVPFGAVTPLFPVEIGIAAFVLGTLVVGMAHGAVDHLVPLRAAAGDGAEGGVSLRRSVAVVSVVYAVLGGAVVVTFVAAPAVAFVGFLGLTWLHWGQGDVAALAVAGVEHLPTRGERALTLFVRGGLPMAVPLVSRPEEYRLVLERVVGLFVVDGTATTATTATTALDPLFAPATRFAIGAAMAVATLLSLGLGYRRVRNGADRRGWLRDVGETGLLWAWFLLSAPVFAIGVYFAAWHSLRHVGRLLLVDPDAVSDLSDDARGVRGALRRFARDAAPLTLGGFLVVGGMALAVPSGVGDAGDLLAVSLVAIAALTLPHVVVVAWLDGKQGVWRPAGRG